MAQVVGRIIEAGPDHAATDQSQAALAGAGATDAHSGAGDKDAQANPHDRAPSSGGLEAVLGAELLGLGPAGGGLLGKPGRSGLGR